MSPRTHEPHADRESKPPADRTRALFLTTGIAGISSVALLFGGQGLMQVGGVEPAFDAPAAEILAFSDARDP